MAKKVSLIEAQEAVEIWKLNNFSRKKSALQLGLPERTFSGRLEKAVEYGILENSNSNPIIDKTKSSARINCEIKNGIVLIGSDAHYWPNNVSTAHKAFVKMARELNPSLIIMNGDVLDGAGISRHPPIGWEKKPDLVDEIEECKARLEDIELACPKARRIWTLGNHDARFETRLATVAPQYAKIHGIHLKDHFPKWENAWSAWINNDVVVKHRYKGGLHATHNNTLSGGKSMVTGHLHSLKVTPYSDYNGTRYGIDCGTLAPVYTAQEGPTSDQFLDYTEDGPLNWRSGFVVLTFENGELLWPEIVHVMDKKRFQFRGKVYYA